MNIGIWVLGDQININQAALQSCTEKDNIFVIMIESLEHIQVRPYHQQKLVLIWSAMRHFAVELRQAGWQVTHTVSTDFETPLKHWVETNQITELRVMKPNDKPFLEVIKNLQIPCDLTIIPNNLFIWHETEFKEWVRKRKRLLMEYFYREGRKRLKILMNQNKPVGEKWNFDKENRKYPKGKLNTPQTLWFQPDEITREVINQVKDLNFTKYGEIEPFRWAVTRQQALQVLDNFIQNSLPNFGDYQDAMVTGEETLWHSLLSPYINLGLLHPLEVIKKVELADQNQQLKLNSVEGFIRQILGWREYMRGVYLLMDDEYSQSNWFNHNQPLPEFFWDANKTDMNCLHQVLIQVQNTGYAHHIQRLMVLSNFALISGISPQEVENWFHAAFIDAYDWVMQTNVLGMGLFADGGILASKPYAASANYINKMSDYCQDCVYDWKVRVTSPQDKGNNSPACPFNYFYWDFLARHRDKLKSQGRMNFVLANLDKIDSEELENIHLKAEKWHSQKTSCRSQGIGNRQ
ncbi:MAG: cryptochrome/photolyase family protein [Okeania sp. SIO2G4]|uniref:cryptochrome/photolyase family protein n=1 Tax=unclassified Okeania TaxID=2634635 RepID=UPI0013B802D1|nr:MULTISPECIES: cryptochrome/photolyase family protein [unclassified Okeania]NEP38868.1 cryptochrome/photolyase family protein [Okeania sp. SIO2H7]NEP70627.1 cryptochrome/photolyase family protein [Okeania sp. SIO2G5]NEP91871.1 cryptochrome/photolyase family protein [Okeania sp. SIO2F5]NEQ89295.1 cryptochrome/photolyase family protein [Okeania sp. SIO2G4]